MTSEFTDESDFLNTVALLFLSFEWQELIKISYKDKSLLLRSLLWNHEN